MCVILAVPVVSTYDLYLTFMAMCLPQVYALLWTAIYFFD